MRPPDFWRRRGLVGAALAPLGTLYALGGRLRWAATRPWRAPVPVICVGNLTVGGAGKTPVAMAIAERLAAAGRAVHIVSRGYGGRLAGPVWVDAARHTAADVGDEPLLLAGSCPTHVARDRRAGIRAAVAAGADLVVLDDGYQNPTVVKDIGLVVVDGPRGFGNRRVLPAGPLREPIVDGLARASAVVIMDDDAAGVARLAHPLPVLRARVVPVDDGAAWAGRRVFAFAGIAHPEKLFATLGSLGADVVGTRAFADHHPYTAAEIAALLAEAAALAAEPVTTGKDAVRLPPALAARITTLAVRVAWADPAALDRVLAPVLEGAATRRSASPSHRG